MLAKWNRYYSDRRRWEPFWLRRFRQTVTVVGLATVAYTLAENPPRRFFYVLVVLSALTMVISFVESNYRERWTRGQLSTNP